MSEYKLAKHCNICGGSDLNNIFDLPSLPLTGIYYPSKSLSLESKKFDQALLKCNKCGHCQLKNVIDPNEVYDDSYKHRSSESSISKKGNDYFFNFIKDKVPITEDKKILEIGCNDGYLLNKLSFANSTLIGIDPLWINEQSPKSDKFKIIGGFAGQIKEIVPSGFRPNLIVSAHAFEHTVDLYNDLQEIIDIAEDGAEIFIEMPSFDTLLRLRRFDQIFHQHIQYINESSIRYLIKNLNCSLKSINYNRNYWGGTVIFNFQKNLIRKSIYKNFNY